MNIAERIAALPQIPANCFGLAIPSQVKTAKSGTMVSEKVLWFKEPSKKVVKNDVIATNEDIDTCWLDTDVPGSDKRISDLAAHYAKGDEVSPFVSTDDEVAEQLLYKFVDGSLTDNLTSGKELHEVIRSIAESCM